MTELKHFVGETLKQIMDGVLAGQEHAAQVGALVNPRHITPDSDRATGYSESHSGRRVQLIDFDVALTTVESDKAKAGVGIFVAAVGLGTQGETSGSTSSSSRIKFSVPLCLPVQARTQGERSGT